MIGLNLEVSTYTSTRLSYHFGYAPPPSPSVGEYLLTPKDSEYKRAILAPQLQLCKHAHSISRTFSGSLEHFNTHLVVRALQVGSMK